MKKIIFMTLLFSGFGFLFGADSYMSGKTSHASSLGPSSTNSPSSFPQKRRCNSRTSEPPELVLNSVSDGIYGLDESFFKDILYYQVEKIKAHLEALNFEFCQNVIHEFCADNYFTYAARLYYKTRNLRHKTILNMLITCPLLFEIVDINHCNAAGYNTLMYIIATGDKELFGDLMKQASLLDLNFGNAELPIGVAFTTLKSLDELKVLSDDKSQLSANFYSAIRLGNNATTGKYFIAEILEKGGTVPPKVQALYKIYNS